jgi:hypothetical protein
MHQLERWRDRLLESDGALTELLAAHPQADAQRLRTLIRNAQKEMEAGKPRRIPRDISGCGIIPNSVGGSHRPEACVFASICCALPADSLPRAWAALHCIKATAQSGLKSYG